MRSTLPTIVALLLTFSTFSLAKVCPKYCDQCPTEVSSCLVVGDKGVIWLVNSCSEDCGAHGFFKGPYLCDDQYGCNTDPNPNPPTPSPAPQNENYTAGWGDLTVYARNDNNEMYVAIWDAATPPVMVGRGWFDLKPGTSADFASRLPAKVVVSKPEKANPDAEWTVQYNGQKFTTQDKKFCADGQGRYNPHGQRTTNCGFTIEGTPGKLYKAGTNDPM